MFDQVHQLKKLRFSKSEIGRKLEIDRKTVAKYFSMSLEEYLVFLDKLKERSRLLDPYEDFVAQKLNVFPDTTAAQMHDWLKEHHVDFPQVSPKTVFNFVMWIRQKYNIPKQVSLRDFHMVEELAYGEQAQIDFGEYSMRTVDARRIKVYFFLIVLLRSRQKFVVFDIRPFTTQKVIQAMELSFEYYEGIPRQLVFDQDKTVLTNENYGLLILTEAFRAYIQSRGIDLHFCHKSDPQSKGKVENGVKYVKQNFLHNRQFEDIDMLNNQAVLWLSRTANALPHAGTKKVPQQEWIIEKEFLKPFQALVLPGNDQNRLYAVRKDNTFSFKGNFYTLPSGTYAGCGTTVRVQATEDQLVVTDPGGQLLVRHSLCRETGKMIVNNNHKRDTSASVLSFMDQLAGLFSNKPLALDYLRSVRQTYPRYARDQFQLLSNTVKEAPQDILDQTLELCMEHNITNTVDFKEILQKQLVEIRQPTPSSSTITLLEKNRLHLQNMIPEKSNISDYHQLILKL